MLDQFDHKIALNIKNLKRNFKNIIQEINSISLVLSDLSSTNQ